MCAEDVLGFIFIDPNEPYQGEPGPVSDRSLLTEVGTHFHNNASIIFTLRTCWYRLTRWVGKTDWPLPDLNNPPGRRNLNHSLHRSSGDRCALESQAIRNPKPLLFSILVSVLGVCKIYEILSYGSPKIRSQFANVRNFF